MGFVKIKQIGLALLCCVAVIGSYQASANAAEKIRLAYSSLDASSLPWFYAQEKGYFTKHGLDSGELIYLDSGSKGVQALISGSIDMVTADGNALVNAGLAGSDIKAIGVTLGVLPSSAVVAKDIASAQDLKGKRFAISSFGSETQLALQILLKANGLAENDVTAVQVGNQANRFAALQAGQVSGSFFQPPILVKAVAEGYKVLAEMPELAPDYLSVGIGAMEETVETRRPVVKAFLEALAEATAALKKDEAGSVEVIQKYLKSSKEDAEGAWRFFAPLFKSDLRPTPASIQFILDRKTDPKAKTMTPADFVDLSVLDELDKEGFFKNLN
ncbi:NitT/TauT family transport system substrate-binding protein [Rhodoligotrophos appendicifer]|uniref:ABC transporter substrate-binding protein n=1 Tax=Rhodoligotrophos appendicifer TaxID=987056 RepID=UPI00147829D5|nr:ABC transporter substrate-binding protein [Rhodoligotrophos appendicifer]